MTTLLPPSWTRPELAMETAFAPQISRIPVEIHKLWNPAECPAELLPWLAATLSVDVWDPEWPEQTQRDVIAASISVHRHKGTVAAVKAALVAAGYGASTLIEGATAEIYNGAITHDGSKTYATADHWATYQVILERAITFDQAETLARILTRVAPARCHLSRLTYVQANNRYNGAITHDGAYAYGIAEV